MAEHHFISYSRVDGAEFAERLAGELEGGTPAHRVWLDRRDIRPGVDWDVQIEQAIRGCKGLLFVMTRDSVRAGSNCKAEWVHALECKKPVIPLLVDRDAQSPFRLASRQFVDFSDDFGRGLAYLREHLQWITTREGKLSEARNRLADAERNLARAEPATRARIQQEIEVLHRRIDELTAVDDDEGQLTVRDPTRPRYRAAALARDATLIAAAASVPGGALRKWTSSEFTNDLIGLTVARTIGWALIVGAVVALLARRTAASSPLSVIGQGAAVGALAGLLGALVHEVPETRLRILGLVVTGAVAGVYLGHLLGRRLAGAVGGAVGGLVGGYLIFRIIGDPADDNLDRLTWIVHAAPIAAAAVAFAAVAGRSVAGAAIRTGVSPRQAMR